MRERARRVLAATRRALRVLNLIVLDRDPSVKPRYPVNRGRAWTCPMCGGIGCSCCEAGAIYPNQEE